MSNYVVLVAVVVVGVLAWVPYWRAQKRTESDHRVPIVDAHVSTALSVAGLFLTLGGCVTSFGLGVVVGASSTELALWLLAGLPFGLALAQLFLFRARIAQSSAALVFVDDRSFRVVTPDADELVVLEPGSVGATIVGNGVAGPQWLQLDIAHGGRTLHLLVKPGLGVGWDLAPKGKHWFAEYRGGLLLAQNKRFIELVRPFVRG